MHAYFEKIVPEQNCFRFYELMVEEDLFTDRSLTVRWGRIGRPGSLRIKGSGTAQEMDKLAGDLMSRRLKRGYVSAS